MVATCHQTRARGGAQRSGVIVRVTQTFCCESVESRCLKIGAVRTKLRVSHIVKKNDNNVRCVIAWGLQGWPPRSGVLKVTTSNAFEIFAESHDHTLKLKLVST